MKESAKRYGLLVTGLIGALAWMFTPEQVLGTLTRNLPDILAWAWSLGATALVFIGCTTAFTIVWDVKQSIQDRKRQATKETGLRVARNLGKVRHLLTKLHGDGNGDKTVRPQVKVIFDRLQADGVMPEMADYRIEEELWLAYVSKLEEYVEQNGLEMAIAKKEMLATEYYADKRERVLQSDELIRALATHKETLTP